MSYELDWIGATLPLMAVFVAIGLVFNAKIPIALRYVICAGLLLRIVGALARHTVLMELYGGVGDAVGYYSTGLRMSAQFLELDLSPILDASGWRNGRWWGTQFVYYPAAFVAAIIGPSLLGGFMAFSLLAFIGLAGFLLAFRRSYPHVPLQRYAMWTLLLPSVWFWPSSVGKEALILFGLGLAVAGFIGRNERVNWPLLAIGLFFVFAVRPQIAAVFFLSMMMAQWAGHGSTWNFMKVVQAALILAVGLAGIHQSMSSLGVDGFDIEGVQDYVESSAARSVGGGSSIDAVDVGWAGVPLAMINILARPFLWEVHNPMALFSSLELVLFWTLIIRKRRTVAYALRHWRSDRLLRLAVPFILLYTIALGLMVTNLGVISRQRVLLFPFLVLLLEAIPQRGKEVSDSDESSGREPATVPDSRVVAAA